jgi:Kef-type K+ transport system membrane component KefB
MGLTAWAGTSSAIDVVRARYTVEGPLTVTLKRASGLGDLMAIFAFGILFAFFHAPVLNATLARPPTPVEWATLSVGIGLGLGALFSFYLDDDDSENGVLLVLVGIISFAAGAAYFLQLSPLFICLVVGMVMVNTSHAGPRVRDALEGTRYPMRLLLLILAGALWTPPPWLATIALAIGYLVLRMAGKWLACVLGTLGTPLRRDLSRGLVGQGQVALAMAVSFRIVFASDGTPSDNMLLDATYSAILLAVLVNELAAPRMLKGLFVDAGVIRREADPHGGL